MDLQQLKLNELQILWTASGGNPPFKKLIEQELQVRIAKNSSISREFIFKHCKIGGHAMTVSFIGTSESYKKYGSDVTVDLLVNDKDMEEMIKNYSAKPPIDTFGKVKAKVLIKDNLSLEQIEQLATDGFNTWDILSIM